MNGYPDDRELPELTNDRECLNLPTLCRCHADTDTDQKSKYYTRSALLHRKLKDPSSLRFSPSITATLNRMDWTRVATTPYSAGCSRLATVQGVTKMQDSEWIWSGT